MRYFNVGGPIAVAVLGAILAFAVGTKQVAGINLSVIGFILLGAAVIWLLLGFLATRPRSVQSTERTVASPDGSQVEREVTTDGI